MDGVIIDSEPWQMESFCRVFKPFGIKLTVEQLKKYVGMRDRDIFIELKKIYNIPFSIEKLKGIKRKEYFAILEEKIVPRENLIEILNYSKSK